MILDELRGMRRGKKGSGTGEFGNLHGIYCDKSTGWIYVADTANNRIQVFKPAG
jgi:DNA-binding beta-propeller fold protein YncE